MNCKDCKKEINLRKFKDRFFVATGHEADFTPERCRACHRKFKGIVKIPKPINHGWLPYGIAINAAKEGIDEERIEELVEECCPGFTEDK